MYIYALFHVCYIFRRLEESEKKRQAMMQAMKDQSKAKGPNFTITKKDLSVTTLFFFHSSNYIFSNWNFIMWI